MLRAAKTPLAIIGSNDWREGVMHHKFIVADVVSTARGLDLDAAVL
jgi:hypothetical protein